MTGESSSPVIVVGGGIGGLASALALSRSGVQVTLLEQAPAFGEVGAGLQLAPNATAVLDRWGLLDRIVSVGVLPENLIFRDALTGDEIARQPLRGEFVERYGAPYVVVHRSDLHTILLEAAAEAGVELVTDAAVADVISDDEGATVHLTDGRALRAVAVIAADGLRSTLRRAVVEDEPVASGFVAYRGTCPVNEAALDGPLRDVVAWLGPECHLVQYPLRQGDVLNQVAVFLSPAFVRGEDDWGGPDELDEAFGRCVTPVRDALSHMWRDRRWLMYDREPIDNWVNGRTTLLGDSAHPMLQYLAQGACQAIEDAWVLNESVQRHVLAGAEDWSAALHAFNDERAPRTARVQRAARTWGESWHVDGIGRMLRNLLFSRRTVSEYQDVDWLYEGVVTREPAARR